MGPVSATLLDGTVITAATFDKLTETIDAHVAKHGPTDPVAPPVEVVEPPSPDITTGAVQPVVTVTRMADTADVDDEKAHMPAVHPEQGNAQPPTPADADELPEHR